MHDPSNTARPGIWLAWGLTLALASAAPGQAWRSAGGGLRRDSEIPAPRLLFYSLMLGEQPAGALTWYGMVEPLLKQQRIQEARQRQIDEMQTRVNALRTAPGDQRPRRRGTLPPEPPASSTRAAAGQLAPPRRPAAGFQRYGAAAPGP